MNLTSRSNHLSLADRLCSAHLDLFERRKKYDTPIWQARHPKLNEYIADVVRDIMEQVVQGNVSKVVQAIIKTDNNQILENFVFDLEWLSTSSEQLRIQKSHLPLLLRSILLKVNNISSALVDLPCELSFSIFLAMNDDDEVMPGQSGWVPGDEPLGEKTIVPVRATDLGFVKMQIFVEESPTKLELQRHF